MESDRPRAPRSTELFGTLGPLELSVLEILCAKREATCKEVQVGYGSNAAYTTISTTLDRLCKKGIVARRKHDRRVLYAPVLTPEDLVRQRCLELLRACLATNPDLVVSQVLDSIAERDAGLLERLERNIEEWRKRANQ